MADTKSAKNAIEEYLNELLLDDLEAPAEASVATVEQVAPISTPKAEESASDMSQSQAENLGLQQEQESISQPEIESDVAESPQVATHLNDISSAEESGKFNESSFTTPTEESKLEPQVVEIENLETDEFEDIEFSSSDISTPDFENKNLHANTADFNFTASGATEDIVSDEAKVGLNDFVSQSSTDFSSADNFNATAATENTHSFSEQDFSASFAKDAPKTQTQQMQETAEEAKTYSESVKSNIIMPSIIMPKLKLASGEEITAERGADKEIKLNPSDFTPPPPPANWDNGRPEWGQNRFDCLLFTVMGLTLAVPLVELGGILRIEEAPKALFGQPDWFLGLMRANDDENVYLVDTAKWVLPPSLLQAQEQEPYEFVIKIHNSNWGLCCNKVAEAISLEPNQVKWRGSGSRRPWLAGTVIKEMCALVDVSSFAQLLQNGHQGMQPVKV